jgi:hypothetical protein
MTNDRLAARVVRWALLASVVLGARAAAAQDVAAAEALFAEGKALREKGDWQGACAKFAESQRLDPSSGTALNLANCHRKLGKTATAWAEYKAAARLARQQGKTSRAEEADKNAAELEGELSYLTINAPNAVPGLELRRDEVRLEQGSLGSRLPVDPGKHVIIASAPGYQTVTLEVVVGATGDAKVVEIPVLERAVESAPKAPGTPPSAAAENPLPPAPPSASEEKKGRGPAPWVVGGIGVAALGVGAAFAGLAAKTYSDAKGGCPSRVGCSSTVLDQRSQANTYANVANGMIPVGAAAVGVAIVLYVVAPKTSAEKKPGAFTLVPGAGSALAGLSAKVSLR